MENILEETKFIMKKYNIRANKSLGQNFLINEEVVKNIVECSKIFIRKSRKSNMYRTRYKNVTNTRR